MAKTTKRLRYSHGGVHSQRNFEGIDDLMEQNRDDISSQIKKVFPKPNRSFTRNLGRGFGITIKPGSSGKSYYGIKWTKPFGKK
tara:strand:+ start:115 stop:366 length:252 start_codon:yes stop_codon:yes gene_type:complete